MRGSMNQGLGIKVAFLILNPNDLLQEFLLSIPAPLSSGGLEVIVLKRKMLRPWNIIIFPLNGKLRCHLAILGHRTNSQERIHWVSCLILNTKGELGIVLLYNKDRYPRVSLEPERFSGKTLSTSTSIRKDD